MNSFPFHVSDWTAPATRRAVVITISEAPAGARMTESPEGAGTSAAAATDASTSSGNT